MDTHEPIRSDGRVLKYTAYITLKNGQRIYASSKGLKAFCIWVLPDKQ
jgi:hypothetical protein